MHKKIEIITNNWKELPSFIKWLTSFAMIISIMAFIVLVPFALINKIFTGTVYLIATILIIGYQAFYWGVVTRTIQKGDNMTLRNVTLVRAQEMTPEQRKTLKIQKESGLVAIETHNDEYETKAVEIEGGIIRYILEGK